MPHFAYQAADTLGRVVQGNLDADSEAEVTRRPAQQSLIALRVRRARTRRDTFETAGGKTRVRLRLAELLEFSRQLKARLTGGITILATLGLLRQRARGPYRALLERIAGDIQRGGTLSEALAAHPRTFDPFYVGTIRAGEAAGVHAAALAGWRLSPLPRVRALAGRGVAALPLVGHVLYLGSVVQFCRMLALLERSGLPLLESLGAVAAMLLPGPIRNLVQSVRRQVATGSSISDALAGTRILPELVEQMVLVGEQTGRIDETLAAAAQHYDEEMRMRIRRLTTLLEPVLTVTISALVLGVALAIFLPMWQLNSLLLRQ